MDSYTIQAGDYYLGDPCYCFTHETWSNLLDECDYLENPYTKNGLTAIAFGTESGDGIYDDQYGNSYGVDAGLIGLVPVLMAEKFSDDLSRKVTFNEPTRCCRKGSKLYFGKIVIETGD